MAYYGSGVYDDEFEGHNWSSSGGSYGVVPYQSPVSYHFQEENDSTYYETYPNHEYHEPNYVDYYPNDYVDSSRSQMNYYSSYNFIEPNFSDNYPYSYASDSNVNANRLEMNYHAYNFIEPKSIMYEPLTYETRYLISYNTLGSEFNEPEYKEYDPTPYDGGYDPVQTYGKPLPPSNETCYPPSSPKPDAIPLENFSYRSIPPAYGGNGSKKVHFDESGDTVKSPKGTDPAEPLESDTVSEPLEKNEGYEKGSNPIEALDAEREDDTEGHGKPNFEQLDSHQGEEREGYQYGNSGYADYSWCGYGNESEKQETQAPSGSYLCEGIFGYFPCLRKKKRSNGNQKILEERQANYPWEGAANYLFGCPHDYGLRPGNGTYYGTSNYVCESYYQHQQEASINVQEEYNEGKGIKQQIGWRGEEII